MYSLVGSVNKITKSYEIDAKYCPMKLPTLKSAYIYEIDPTKTLQIL